MKIWGKSLIDIEQVKSVGGPFFLYDLDGLRNHLKSFRSLSLKMEGIHLFYATKANPLLSIINVVKECDLGIDVASSGELFQSKRAQFDGIKIISTGPAKDKKLIKELLEKDIRAFVVESARQIELINELATSPVKVLLRIQHDWDKGTSVLGGSETTPFGLDPESWKKVDFSKFTKIKVIGAHTFQWGNITDLKELESIWSSIAQRSLKLFDEINLELQVLDLGGGIGISYTDQNPAIKVKDALNSIRKIKEKSGINQFWMELGRFAIGEFGTYFTKVIDKKTVKNKEFLILESGINHLLRPPLVDSPFPIFTENNDCNFDLRGPLCTSLDSLGTQKLPSKIKPGDYLAFSKTGAYGFTEAMPYFLCHPVAAEAIYENENMKIIRPIMNPNEYLY